MRQVVLDANVALSYLTDRNPEQQEKAGRLFLLASTRELGLVLHQLVLSEIVYVLRNHYRVGAEETSEILRDLLAGPGVRPVDRLVWSRVLGFWPSRFPDFADAALASVVVEDRWDCVATFDRDFAKRLRGQGIACYW